MEKEKIESYYQSEAKQIIDVMFEAKIFKPETTRDDMNDYEDLLAYLFQAHARSAQITAHFLEKMKLNK